MTVRCVLALLLILPAALALAASDTTGNAFLVADLVNDEPAPAVPRVRADSVLVVGDTFLCAGHWLGTGEELWRSDGTPAGTTLVMDVNPGMTGSGIAGLTSVGDLVYFFADDGTHGFELWRTDGTTAGTAIVRDVCPGECDGTPGRYGDVRRERLITGLGEIVLFPGNDGVHGPELWRSDGTAAGTEMIVDAAPGETGAGARQLTPVGSVVFYVGGANLFPRLWLTDGTEAGTRQVSDVGPVEMYFGIGPTSLAAVGSRLVFVVDDGTLGSELWSSDGSEAGTALLADLCPGACSGMPNGDLLIREWHGRSLFRGTTPTNGAELWETDGTPAGTRLLIDFNPGSGDGLREIAPSPDALFVVASDGRHGEELWVGDGTAAGTRMIHDFWPGRLGAGGSNFVAAGGLLYFSSYGGLWRSDGTLRGTGVIFASLPRPPYPTTPELPVAELGGRLLFVAADERGTGVFATDGSWAGTEPVAVIPDVDAPLPGSWPWLLRATLGGLTFFTNRAAPLYHTQGRPGTTVPVQTGPYQVRTEQIATSGESIFFFGVGGLWRTSLANPMPTVIHTRPYGPSERMSNLTNVGERVFFVDEAPDGIDKEVAVVNADGNGATIVKDICVAECWGVAPAGLTPFGDRLAFTTNTHGIYDGGVWLTDGTETGTIEVAKLGGGSYSQYDDYALTASGPLLYFARETPESGQELWVGDGTPGAASPLGDICPGACNGLPYGSVWRNQGVWRIVAASPGRIYFLADDGVHGRELWVSDGTPATTRLVADLTPGARSSPITWMTAAGSGLFFSFDDGEHGRELWSSDGTTEGTRLVEDINPGLASGVPSHLAWADGVLLFAATDGAHGLEPWRSDGTWSGTRLVTDIVPGPASSSPAELTRADGRVYFRAYDPGTGFELWAVEPGSAGVRVRRATLRR